MFRNMNYDWYRQMKIEKLSKTVQCVDDYIKRVGQSPVNEIYMFRFHPKLKITWRGRQEKTRLVPLWGPFPLATAPILFPASPTDPWKIGKGLRAVREVLWRVQIIVNRLVILGYLALGPDILVSPPTIEKRHILVNAKNNLLGNLQY